MSGYAPIPGSPDVVEGLAAALRDEAQRIASAHTRLLSLRQGVRWDSPAGDAFSARVRELPPVLDAIAQRYAGAAAALRAFAAAFREAQEACNLAMTLRERGALRRDRYAEELAAVEASGSPADLARVPLLRELMAEGAGEVLANERRWLQARDRFDQADARCRRALESLADDTLADSWQYDGLKGGIAVADAVGSTASVVGLVPPCRPVAVPVGSAAGASGLLGRGVLRAAYGEGSWSALGEELALAAVGPAAGSLRAGALARGLPSAAHHGPTGFATPGQRLTAGVKEQVNAGLPWRAAPPAPAAPSPPSGFTSAASASLPHHLRRVAEQAVRRRIATARTEWATAARNGRDARIMLATAYGLEAGSGAYQKGKAVNAAREKAALVTGRGTR